MIQSGAAPEPGPGASSPTRLRARHAIGRVPERVSAARPSVAALAFFTLVAVVLTWQVWSAPGSSWVGSCCDQEQQMWFLRWIPYALQHGANPFFTTQLNWPDGVNLMWNTSIAFLSLAFAPVTLAVGPVVAYNVAIVVALALSGWLAFVAIRRYTSVPGAVVGGAVFELSPYLVSHASLHLNLTAAWSVPLFLILLDEIVVRQARSPAKLGVALGLLAACQLLTSEEILATSAIASAVLLGILAAHAGPRLRSGVRRLLIAAATALPVFLLLAAWPLAVQFFGAQRISGAVQDQNVFSTDLLNLIVPTRYQLLAPDAATRLSNQFSGLAHEADAYLGLPLLLLLAVTVGRLWDDLRVRVASLAGGIMLALSLGPHLVIGSVSTGIPMPWIVLGQLPLLQHVVPARLVLFAWLAVGSAVAIVVDRALAAPPIRGVSVLAALAFGLACIVPAPLAAWSATSIPTFFVRWAQEGIPSGSTVLIAPFFRDGAGADPMLWAAVAGDEVRMPEAYAFVPLAGGIPNYGPVPNALSATMETIQDKGGRLVVRGTLRDQIAADLRAERVADVIVGPMRYQQQMLIFFEDLFGRPATYTDGVYIWRGVDRSGVVAPS